MRLMSFHKVGPSEYTAWWRGNNYILSARGDRWLVAHDGALLAKVDSERDARALALAHQPTAQGKR